jgi:hypothetical protein
MAMSSFNECITARYRAAISLNNSAVTLLKREHYKDSVETFRTSISILQTIVGELKNPNSTDVKSMSTLVHDINCHLQDASHYCATANYTLDMTDRQPLGTVVVLKVFSQQNPSSVIDEIIEPTRDGAAHVFPCIVIEPFGQDGVCLELIVLDCYSILYNFGVVHCLLACELSSSLKSDPILIHELRQSAFRLLCLIEPYFLVSLYPAKLNSRRVLLLCALFAKTMYEVACHLRYWSISERYKSTLFACLVLIGHHENFAPTRKSPASAA